MNHRGQVLVAAVLLLTPGCSSKPASPPYEPTQAVETLGAALDAWCAGQVDSLAKRQPPIRFEDDDFRSGLVLVTYELVPREGPIRAHDDVSVHLSLRDQQGATHEKTVVYQVTLEPSLAVLRND